MVKKATAKAAETAEVKETAKTVAEATAEETKEAAPVEKKTVKKTTVKKAATAAEKAAKTVVKEAVEKVEKVEKTAKSVKAAVKAETNTEVYIQFWGKEVYAKDVVENIKKIWTDEMGKKASDLKDLKVYIKPEDNGAHYVINGEITGFYGL